MTSDPNPATEPIELDNIPPVDLVVCPGCKTVITLHDVEDVQEVEEEGGFLGSGEIHHGVWCPNPGCEQKLYDHRTWAKHLAARLKQEETEAGKTSLEPDEEAEHADQLAR